jgi:hypothetical protein
MAPGKSLMGIEPFPMVKNSSLSTIGSNPFGLKNLKDMGVGFDPLMCGKALTRIEPCPMVKNSLLSTIGSNPFF